MNEATGKPELKDYPFIAIISLIIIMIAYPPLAFLAAIVGALVAGMAVYPAETQAMIQDAIDSIVEVVSAAPQMLQVHWRLIAFIVIASIVMLVITLAMALVVSKEDIINKMMGVKND